MACKGTGDGWNLLPRWDFIFMQLSSSSSYSFEFSLARGPVLDGLFFFFFPVSCLLVFSQVSPADYEIKQKMQELLGSRITVLLPAAGE